MKISRGFSLHSAIRQISKLSKHYRNNLCRLPWAQYSVTIMSGLKHTPTSRNTLAWFNLLQYHISEEIHAPYFIKEASRASSGNASWNFSVLIILSATFSDFRLPFKTWKYYTALVIIYSIQSQNDHDQFQLQGWYLMIEFLGNLTTQHEHFSWYYPRHTSINVLEWIDIRSSSVGPSSNTLYVSSSNVMYVSSCG